MTLRFSPARGAGAFSLSSYIRGPAGAAATITAGTQTALSEGSTPTVANSGTSSAAIFDFGIPRGVIPAIGFNFSTTTADSDPGAGNVRFNNATVASVTAIYFDNVDRDGNTVTGWLDSFDDGTSTSKGTLVITPAAGPTAKLIYAVTGSVVDGTGYRKVTVAWVSGTVLPTNVAQLAFAFYQTGDQGTGIFPGVSVDSEVALFSGTGGITLKRATGSGLAKLTSGVQSIASAGTDYYAPGSTDVAVADGGTGASTAAAGIANLGGAPLAGGALTGGFTSASVSAGTKSSGTYTFDPTAGGVQHCTNGGAFTLAPPATNGSWMLDITNNASAGAITTSGWTKVDGDAFDTTNTHAFRCTLSVGNAGSYLSVKRMV